MLSSEDNELLCRSGRGTPMGDLLRQYWLPALPSRELPEPDGEPKKVRRIFGTTPGCSSCQCVSPRPRG